MSARSVDPGAARPSASTRVRWAASAPVTPAPAGMATPRGGSDGGARTRAGSSIGADGGSGAGVVRAGASGSAAAARGPGRRRLGSGRRARRRRRRGRQGLRGRGGRGRLDHRHDRRLVGAGEPGRSAEAHRGRDGAHRQQAGALAGAAHDACRARLTALS